MYHNPYEEIHRKLDALHEKVASITPTSAPPQIEVINGALVCERLDITMPTLIRWRKKGRIPSLQIGSSIRYNWPVVVEALQKKGGAAK